MLRIVLAEQLSEWGERGSDKRIFGVSFQSASSPLSPRRAAYALWHRVVGYAHAKARAVEMVLGYVVAHDKGHLQIALSASDTERYSMG
jgi:hypothetical protein